MMEEQEPMYWANVYGPATSGPYGCDTYAIDSPESVTFADGFLSVVSKHKRGTPIRTTTYPAGQWTKVKTGQTINAEVA